MMRVDKDNRPAFKLMVMTKVLRSYTIGLVTKANVMIPKYLCDFLDRVFKEWDTEPEPDWYTLGSVKTLSGANLYKPTDQRTPGGFGETGARLNAAKPVKGILKSKSAWNPRTKVYAGFIRLPRSTELLTRLS